MLRHKRSRSVAILAIILSIMFLASFVACEMNHDCTGDCCPTRAILSIFEKMLKILTTATILAILSLILKSSIIEIINGLDYPFIQNTPVLLKVKLLD